MRRKFSGEGQSQGHRKSSSNGGNARQDLDSAREGIMAFRCIFVMDFCDGGQPHSAAPALPPSTCPAVQRWKLTAT